MIDKILPPERAEIARKAKERIMASIARSAFLGRIITGASEMLDNPPQMSDLLGTDVTQTEDSVTDSATYNINDAQIEKLPGKEEGDV